jgi:hypothetical protein
MMESSGDYALLRCVPSEGLHVAIHETGQFIATGTRGKALGDKGYDVKIWGPAGGSAFTAVRKVLLIIK